MQWQKIPARDEQVKRLIGEERSQLTNRTISDDVKSDVLEPIVQDLLRQFETDVAVTEYTAMIQYVSL